MHGLSFAFLISMKQAHRKSYKSLYQDSLHQHADKDAVLAVMQQQLTQLFHERNLYFQQSIDFQQQLADEKQVTAMQQQTILGQTVINNQQRELLHEQQGIMDSQQKELNKNKQELQHLHNLHYELQQLKIKIFGIKSEKRHLEGQPEQCSTVKQLSLDLQTDAWGECKISSSKIAEHLRVVKTITPKKCGGRHDFPEGLEEEVIIVDVTDKPANARCVGHVDQRQLACDPMRWYIKVNRRLVYMVPSEDKLHHKQLIAPLPAHPIDKCKLDISVLVLLTIDKYRYHLPLWRQQQRLHQYGIDLPYSSICSVINRTCEALEPLWYLLLKEIMVSGLVSMDETTYRVLDNSKKKGKKSHIGWMWVAMNPIQRIVCFMYQHGRGKKDIDSILHGFKGHLMTDGYGVYKKYGKQPGVTHLNCLSHARRLFMYAKDNDAARADYALDQFFGPLYGIEQECKLLELDYDAITDKRQAESKPLLMDFKKWLDVQLPQTINRTPIHKAIAYTLNHFEGLVRYTDDGILPIDNNELEGQIRAIALGRHNHLFAGSDRGGELSAIIYSFMATCKLHNINPSYWLSDVLRRLPGQPENKLIELLPQFWKPVTQNKKISTQSA